MNLYLLLIISLLFIIVIKSYILVNKKGPKYSNFLKQFRNSFKSKYHIRTKIYNSYSDLLLKDPNKDITINKWDKGDFLLEKASIHKTRLSKFGKSRMNGQIFYKGPRGGVYTLSEEGEKNYV